LANEFFTSKSRCDRCPLELEIKKGKLKRASQKNERQFRQDLHDVSNLDILFITDSVERPEDFDKFFNLIKSKGVKNFAITSAIGCRTFSFELPSPTYETYSYCNSFDIQKYNPKVVVAMGRSLFHFTRSSIFSSWREFREFIFNDTFFYPHIKDKWKGRIYPCGFLSDIFDFSSFEHYHFLRQIEFIQKHIDNYEQEKFIMPSYKVEVVGNFDTFISDHKENKVALDTETSALNMFEDDFKVGCIQASFDGITGYVLPMDIINKRRFSGWLKDKYQIWANGKYDCKCLNREKISGHHVDEDIPLIYHILNTERESNSIKVLSWFIGFGGYEDDLDEYRSKYKIDNYLDIPTSILYSYAGMDAVVTFLLEKNLHTQLVHRQQDTYKMYRDIILPVIPVFQSMEEEGILADKEYTKKYHNILIEKLELIKKEIYKILGKEINIGSLDELGLALEKAGLPDYGRNKKGIYRTGEAVLLQWKKDGYEVIDKLMEYRGLSKLDRTYIGVQEKDSSSFFEDDEVDKNSGIYQHIMSDGRVHGSIMPALTDSLRSLSFSPNMQNFPKSGEEGKAFRRVFIAPEDYFICEADYAGFQLRLMGIYSEDPTMIDAFVTKGGDLHSITGCEIFSQGTDIDYFMEHKKEEPYKTARFNGKTTNLAFCFCQSPYSFQNKIRDLWAEEQVESYIKNNKPELVLDKGGKINKYLTIATDINTKYFIKYPQLDSFAKARQELACKQGYVDCPIFPGARRHLPELIKIASKLPKEKASHYSTLKNIAVNAEAQAGEALNVYIALRKIYNILKEKGYRSRLIGCVHDSIVLYVHKDEVEIMYGVLKNCMERFDYSIPILAEIEVGGVWGFSPEIHDKNLEGFVEKVLNKGK